MVRENYAFRLCLLSHATSIFYDEHCFKFFSFFLLVLVTGCRIPRSKYKIYPCQWINEAYIYSISYRHKSLLTNILSSVENWLFLCFEIFFNIYIYINITSNFYDHNLLLIWSFTWFSLFLFLVFTCFSETSFRCKKKQIRAWGLKLWFFVCLYFFFISTKNVYCKFVGYSNFRLFLISLIDSVYLF